MLSTWRSVGASIQARHGDKVRFLIVGVFNTAFGYGLFLLMLLATSSVLSASPALVPAPVAENHFLLAQWVAWVLSVPVGTATMKYFVFRGDRPLLASIGRSYFVYLPTALLSAGLLWFSVHVLLLAAPIGQLVVIAVATVMSYVGHKYFTFGSPRTGR